MPEICRFLGIVIKMFYDEYNPPHFHAEYGEFKASIRILDYALLEGSLPPKILGLVVEWAAIHNSELIEDWELSRKQKVLMKIKPLE
jgi:hypothetical protein